MESQERQSLNGETGFFYGYFVVIAAFFIMFVMYATYYAFGVFFKPMLNEFGWTRAIISGTFSLSSIMMGLLGFAMGRLTDKFGPRIVMTTCGLLLGLGYVLMSQLDVVWKLYLFYGVIVGAGMGGSFVPLMSTVARWFDKRRSMMTGIVTAGIGIGALVGPPVASRLISAYGWRVSYVILGGIVLAVVVLSSQLIKRDPAQAGQMPYGAKKGEQKGLNPGAEALSLMEAFYTGQFWVVFGMFFCFGFCLFAVMVHIAPHAIELGISAASAANILATIGGLSIVGKILLGRAADIIGNRQIYIICFATMSAALFCLGPVKMVWIFYFFAVIFGLSYGGIVASESPLVALLFGLRSHGSILGVIAVGFTIGGAFGPLLAGHIFDVTGSYRPAFFICAAISFVGLILSFVLKTKKR